ncbi:hypothetical protein [Streptomyces sp. NPDC054829]
MAKATGYAPKLADLTASLRNTNVIPELTGPRSVLELSDGSKLVIEDGRFIAYNRHGEVAGEAPRQEPSLAEGTVPAQERELAGVGAGTHEASGSHTPEPGGAGTVAHGHGGAGSGGSGGGATRSADSGPSGSTGETDGNAHEGAGPGGPDSLGRTGDTLPHHGTDAVPDANGEVAGQSTVPQRPSFMHDGPNPYGPPGSLTPDQIREIQIYRTNHEPGYRERYYKIDGRRNDADIPDESGLVPLHIVRDPLNPRVWILDSDAKPAIPPKYHDGVVIRDADTALDRKSKDALDEAAQKRYRSVSEDTPRHEKVSQAKTEYKREKTPENHAALKKIKAEHAPFHERMTLDAEAYGEAIVKYHVIPEHYAGATWQELDGPRNGNDRFDQAWKRKEGGFVVVEAKSSVDAKLGKRDLPGGLPARQGSKEYFLDILRKMRDRGLNGNASELELYRALKAAYEQGNVEYILVMGRSNTGEYAGYKMRKFDLG